MVCWVEDWKHRTDENRTTLQWFFPGCWALGHSPAVKVPWPKGWVRKHLSCTMRSSNRSQMPRRHGDSFQRFASGLKLAKNIVEQFSHLLKLKKQLLPSSDQLFHVMCQVRNSRKQNGGLDGPWTKPVELKFWHPWKANQHGLMRHLWHLDIMVKRNVSSSFGQRALRWIVEEAKCARWVVIVPPSSRWTTWSPEGIDQKTTKTGRMVLTSTCLMRSASISSDLVYPSARSPVQVEHRRLLIASHLMTTVECCMKMYPRECCVECWNII